MMYFILTLFFASLIGIAIMIGRKLMLIRNGQTFEIYHLHPFIPDFHRITYLTLKSLKRLAYLILFITIRSYFRLSNFLRSKYNETKIKVKNQFNKSQLMGHLPEKREVNKFLKIISDYKSKISEIKHRIKEEENTRPTE